MHSPSSSFLQNSSEQLPTYKILTIQTKNFRVLASQYVKNKATVETWSVFWLILTILSIAISLIALFNLQSQLILVSVSLASLGFTLHVYLNKSFLSTSLYLSCLALSTYLIIITILTLPCIKIKQTLFPTCLYIISQMLISTKLIKIKSQIIIKLLLPIQLILIVLKYDNKIHSSWQQVMLILLTIFMFTCISIFFMTFYIGYLLINYQKNQQLRIKSPGALYIYFSMIAVCFLITLPLSQVYLHVELTIVCSYSALYFMFISIIGKLKLQQIILFFCTVNQVKSYGQNIYFQAIQGLSNDQYNDNYSYNFSKTLQNNNKFINSKKLFLISGNWLTQTSEKASIQLIDQNHKQNPQFKQNNQQFSILSQKQQSESRISLYLSDCVICLDRKAQMVWMPCGHLIVCIECFNCMYIQKSLNCALCKKTPQRIYLIDINKKSQASCKIQQEQGQEKQNKQKYSHNQQQLNKRSKKKMKAKLFKKKQRQQHQNNQKINNIVSFNVIQGYNVKII